MASTSERKAFKDYFDRAAARGLADQVAVVWPRFDRRRFVRLATRDLQSLEFAGRVQQFADALAAVLPRSVPRALGLLSDSLPDPLPDCEAITDGWLQWPIGQYIAAHGLEHFDASFAAMIELTKRFSSEFAVRPFVERRPEQTFSRLLGLTDDPNPHVRRWCSEGTRPRLPWGKKLQALVEDPSPIWPILERLKDDGELYVRRSVANNLNDITKDHPHQVVERCRSWARAGDENRLWLVKQALRTLVKAGDPAALAVIGFEPPRKVEAQLSVKPRRVAIGGDVELRARLHSDVRKPQRLVVDYAVHYVRKAGKKSAKIFKWTTCELRGRAAVELTIRHKLRPTTIRALYPGVHRVELQVNGQRLAEASFRLLASS